GIEDSAGAALVGGCGEGDGVVSVDREVVPTIVLVVAAARRFTGIICRYYCGAEFRPKYGHVGIVRGPLLVADCSVGDSRPFGQRQIAAAIENGLPALPRFGYRGEQAASSRRIPKLTLVENDRPCRPVQTCRRARMGTCFSRAAANIRVGWHCRGQRDGQRQ